jgi:hypothetical protein
MEESARFQRYGKDEGERIKGYTVVCQTMYCILHNEDNWYRRSAKEASEEWNHRAEPEMRPLTLEEIYAKIDDEDWNVVWIEGPDSQKAEPMCPYYKEENKIVFCAPPFVRVWEETISRYGKSWRCWPRKPTPEQMAAEKWEE